MWNSILIGYGNTYLEDALTHCSDGDINEKYESDDGSGTEINGIFFKPGIPYTENGLIVTVLSIEKDDILDSWVKLSIKNNTKRATSETWIPFKEYKNSNTLLNSDRFYVEALKPGEIYERYTSLDHDTKIVIFQNGTASSEKRNISSAKVNISKNSFTCNGKERKPDVEVKLNSSYLKEGRDYSVKYKNNIGVGTAAIVITGIGNYQGTAKATFSIVKGKLTISLSKMTAAYTGKRVSIGKATVKGSTGKVTYQYFTDKSCKKEIKAPRSKKRGFIM